MSTVHDPTASAARARRGWWWYARRVPLRVLAGVLVFIGVVAALEGVGQDVAAATRAPEPVAVPVFLRVHELDRLRVLVAGRPGSRTLVPFRLPQGQGLELYVGEDQSNWISAGAHSFIFNAAGSTVAEKLLANGDGAVFGLCLLWGALLMRRLLLSIGGGQPFQRRNAARVAGIAGLVAVATVAASVLPYLAARLVLGRLGLGGPASPLYARLAISATPLLLALFLLALAQAFRRGTQLASDTDGLV